MKRRFVDTWFLLNLIIETELHHKQALEFFRRYSYGGDEFYASGSLIAETTGCILHSKRFIKVPEKKLLPTYAFKFFEKFKDVVTSGQLKILTANPAQIGNALELLKEKFRAMPDLSYFDCETVVLCNENKIPGVLTGDKHFEYLGLPIDENWAGFLVKTKGQE
jgi:predicted nucleic acid-binding protein